MAKVNNHIPFLTGEICSTAGVTLDENLSEGYSDEVLTLAIQLKANNLRGVGGERENNAKKPLSEASDTFFLQYAQRMLHQQMQAKVFETFHKRANNCPISDPQWAIYSADEILAMEKNGTLIPDDIVAWAHSQQQLDVTNYVLETDSDSEDATVEDTFANTDSLDVLQATAKKNIEKAEKATDKVKEKQEKYNIIAQNAIQLRKNKENEFEKTVNEVKNLTEEWENLKNKKENGELTNNEQQKFSDLSKQLKNSPAGNKGNLNSGKNEMEEFLGELDGLNLEITNTSQIAQDTIYAGRTLNTITKNYNVYNLPYAYTGTSFDNSGLISLTLNGMTNEDIGELAVQKGEELDTNNQITEEDVNGAKYTETIDFATNFTTYVDENKESANKIQNETETNEAETDSTENTTGDETQTNETSDTQNKENAQANNGKPAVEYGIIESIKAANKSINASTTDIDKTTTVNSDNKTLNKEVKTAKREMTVIDKQVDTLNEKLTGNEKDTESFLQELERLQAENPDDSVQLNAQNSTNETQNTSSNNKEQQVPEENTVVKNGQSDFEKAAENATTILGAFAAADNILAENRNQPAQTETTSPEEAAEQAKKAENKNKKLEIAKNIQDLGADRTDISSDLENAIETGDQATQKGIKALTTLNKSNNELTVQNDKTKEDASFAIDTGVGTQALGIMDKIDGIATFSYGVLLTANPFTFSTGLFFMGVGAALQTKGSLEIVSGTLAVTSGAAGKATSSVANGVIGSAISDMTKAQSVLNVNILNINNASTTATESEQNNTQTTPDNAQLATSETDNSAISSSIAQNAPVDGTQTPETAESTDNSVIANTIDNTVTAEPQAQAQAQAPVQTQTQAQTTQNIPTNNAVTTGFAANVNSTEQTQEELNQTQPAETQENNVSDNTNEEINNQENVNETTETAPVENQEPNEIKNEETSNEDNKIEDTNQNPVENNNEVENNEDETLQNTTSNTNETETTQAETPTETTTEETTETPAETENTTQNSPLTQVEENKPENIANNENIEVTTKENETSTTKENTKTEDKKSSSKDEEKEVTEKDAQSAAKESKKLKTEVDAGKKEEQKSQKEMKKISKEIKNINKTTKKDDQNFKKEVQQEQKQIEQKQIEIEQKNQQIQKKQEEQAGLQVDIEALNAAFSSTTADKQTELQTEIQTKSGALRAKNSEISELSAQLGIINVATGKKFKNLTRTVKLHTATGRRNLKKANTANKTAEKILKVADMTSQVAGLTSIAGNITSKIGNGVTLAGNAQITSGNLQITQGTPMLSNPWTASLGAALIASGTSLVVAGSAQVATGTTTSIIGESVSLAANITNAAANATKAVVFADQGNIAGAIMSTGAAIMSGVSASQNISQLGQLNQMAGAANAASTAANNVSEAITSNAPVSEVQKAAQSLSDVVNTGVTDAAGNVVTQGFKTTQEAFAKSAKFGWDDALQIGGALQTVGSMLGTDNDGSADTKKDRKLRRFGTISRINSKKRTQKVNAVSTNSYNHKHGSSR